MGVVTVLGLDPLVHSVSVRRAVLALVGVVAGGCVPNPYYIPPVIDESASDGDSEVTETATATATATSTSTSTSTSGSETDTGVGPTATSGGVCGDGVVDPGESCDDGAENGSQGSPCSITCALKEELCGDGVTDPGEECDDGNKADGDGCSATCAIEPGPNVCGDGVLGDDEACDDGNDAEGDGCEPDCTPTPPGLCGDGVKAWDELCDDGNNLKGDGCEPDCTPTPPNQCVPADALISCDAALKKDDPLAPFKAIGLGCSDDNSKAIPIAKATLAAQDPVSWELAAAFGSYQEMNAPYFGAREGKALLLLSTGSLAAPDMNGVVKLPYNSQVTEGENGNVDDDSFLPGYMPGDDQSGTMQAQWEIGQANPNDKIFLAFSVKVPTGAKAYSLDLAVFSSEWPQFVDTSFNDPFVVWQVGDAYVGNVAIVDGQAITNTSLHPHWSPVPIAGSKDCATFGSAGPGFSCGELQLADTGFEGHAATRWLRLNREVSEGSALDLYFFLADMVDTQSSTVVLLDRFRWLCGPCIPAGDPACEGPSPDLNCCGLALPK